MNFKHHSATWDLLVALFVFVAVGLSTRSWQQSAYISVVAFALLYWNNARCLRQMRRVLDEARIALASYSESAPHKLNTVQIPDSGLAEIIDGFNVLILEAHGSRLLMANIADTIAQHSAKVVESAQFIVEQMEYQSQGTTTVHDALERLQKVFNVTVDTANDATRIAGETEEEGNKGKVVVSEAMGSVMSLSAAITSAGDIVLQLGDQSKEINGVISVIRNLAEQTNLLALNAAIEAARAGEQGRGFAVVADEVRSLANKTQAYTQDISRIIDTLLGMVQSANEAIEETLDLSQKSDELIESVVISYADLVGTLNALRNVGQHLSDATLDEADTATDAYNKLADVQQHSVITQSIVKSVMTASLELQELSSHLKSLAKTSAPVDAQIRRSA